jgi:hypothetical protein
MSRKKIRIRTNTTRKQGDPNLSLRSMAVSKPQTPQTNPLPKGCFLTTEDEPQFRILLGEYIATYNPQHRDEYDLLTEAVYCKWRQQRYWLAESAQIEIAIARNEANLQKELPRADAAAHLANGIAHSEDMLRLYLRYNNQLHRQYRNCLKELRDLQASRPPMNTDHKGGDPTLEAAQPSEPIETPSQPPEPPTNTDRKGGDPTLEPFSQTKPTSPPNKPASNT